MQKVGASSAEQKAFEAQLLTSHRMRCSVRLLAVSTGKELSNLTPRLLDGQVNIDSTSEASRSASVTLDDPDHSMGLDSRGSGDGAVYLDRMLRIYYGVFVDSLGKWLDVPIFTGPVTGLQRDGTALTLTALGKESLALAHTWTPATFGKGHDVVSAIRIILDHRAGEKTFAFPSSGGRLPAPLSLGRMSQPWVEALRLAGSINRHLFYDGAGTCVLRTYPATSTWTFKDGNGGSVLSEPAISYDASAISNAVWVKGYKAKGKPQVTWTSVAPTSSPLNAWALGRNGVPRYIVTEVDNDAYRTRAAAKAYADRLLAQLLREGVDVSFDALPIPHLDPGDWVTLDTAGASISFTLSKASIPLVHSGVMSVGALKNVSPKARR